MATADHPPEDIEDEIDSDQDKEYAPRVRVRQSARLKNRGINPRPIRPKVEKERTNKTWEEWEKDQLLTACRKYGTKDWRRIAAEIPTKSEEVVRAYIKREKRNQTFTIETKLVSEDGVARMIDDGLKQLNKKPPIQPDDPDQPDLRPQGEIEEALTRRDREAPIERWLGILEDIHRQQEANNKDEEGVVDLSSSIPQALNWIAEAEHHPNPLECGGVDYASIYRYLALLCEGEVPPDLNPASAARVSILLGQFCQMVQDTKDLEPEIEYLKNYRGTFTRFCGAGSRPIPAESSNLLRGLSSVPGLNPLQLHTDLFSARSMPGLDSLFLNLEEHEEEEVEQEEEEQEQEEEEERDEMEK